MIKWLLALMFFHASVAIGQGKYITDSLHTGLLDTLVSKKKPTWITPVVMAVAYPVTTYLCYRNLDTRIQMISQGTRNGFKTFIASSVSDMGLGKFQAIALGSTTIVAFVSKNQKLQRTVITWGGALLINSLVTEKVKKIFQRHRPNTGDPYNSFDWEKGTANNRSFASAHTSNAFTTATIFATIYKDHEWVPYVAYGMATLVGASRIYDNAHWLSDVMTGAAFGYLSAKAMNGLYKMASKKIMFLPQAGIHSGSVSLVYSF